MNKDKINIKNFFIIACLINIQIYGYYYDGPYPSLFSIEENVRITYLPVKIPSQLSINSKKLWFYAQDPYFRQGYEQFNRQIPDLEKLILFFENYTFLIIKPDGVITRSVRKILEVLKEYNFQPIAYKIFQFNRHSNILFWFYHSNLSTVDNFASVDLFMNEQNCALIILKDEGKEREKDFACNYLSKQKGHFLTEKRRNDSIRAKIGAGGGLLAFIHMPDEPIDIIRELSVLFNSEALRKLIHSIINENLNLDIDNLEKDLYLTDEYHDLNFETALNKIEKACTKVTDESLKTPLLNFCKQIRKKGKADWQSFLTRLKLASISVNRWDLITICNQCADDPISGITSMYLQ